MDWLAGGMPAWMIQLVDKPIEKGEDALMHQSSHW